jgi:acetyl esterase/lipase
MVVYLVGRKVSIKISTEGVLVPVAVNYRLAPQYPFPCGLHDCLASCQLRATQKRMN